MKNYRGLSLKITSNFLWAMSDLHNVPVKVIAIEIIKRQSYYLQSPEFYSLPSYPKDDVVGPCVCGGWPGGKCFRCPVHELSIFDKKSHQVGGILAPR